ncbi:MAG: hypothetical protein EOO06_09375 [Chitinophagaceae bacterium]|nr:MAG: hypothetical protein EOO06_09375 [Chitinophagaceae bacterium]
MKHTVDLTPQVLWFINARDAFTWEVASNRLWEVTVEVPFQPELKHPIIYKQLIDITLLSTETSYFFSAIDKRVWDEYFLHSVYTITLNNDPISGLPIVRYTILCFAFDNVVLGDDFHNFVIATFGRLIGEVSMVSSVFLGKDIHRAEQLQGTDILRPTCCLQMDDYSEDELHGFRHDVGAQVLNVIPRIPVIQGENPMARFFN